MFLYILSELIMISRKSICNDPVAGNTLNTILMLKYSTGSNKWIISFILNRYFSSVLQLHIPIVE